MESKSAISVFGFQVLRARLLENVKTRIDNGEFSERALARMAGLSQPHLHNVLKGARKLSPEIADVLLAQLEISVLTLLLPDELLPVPRKAPGTVRFFPVKNSADLAS